MVFLHRRGNAGTVEELLKKVAEHFGYAAPFGYAVLAYGLFFWLDKEASDDAKAALARTMTFKDYKNEQVASALVEVFDRIYTYPLLRWRAFFRSLLFTTVVSAIYAFEVFRLYGNVILDSICARAEVYVRVLCRLHWDTSVTLAMWIPGLLFNIFTDYLSLLVIRPLLIRSGTKPVIGLALGTVTGAAIVLAGDFLRRAVFLIVLQFAPLGSPVSPLLLAFVPMEGAEDLIFVWPATAVFAWLPLFALGILIARLLTPLSWIVGKAQWFLKEGKEHPLRAIGYVAAVVVFLGTVAGRAVFSA
jgi:hypothetical protein